MTRNALMSAVVSVLAACGRTPLPAEPSGPGAGSPGGDAWGVGDALRGETPPREWRDARLPSEPPPPAPPPEAWPCCDVENACSPAQVQTCERACEGQAMWDLSFSDGPSPPLGSGGRSDIVSGTLTRVDGLGFEVKTVDGFRTFELSRPERAPIPFVAGEDIVVEYVIPDRAGPHGQLAWSVVLLGAEGPRYGARGGPAPLTDALLGVWIRAAAVGCVQEYIGDCIQARNAIAVLEDLGGTVFLLGNQQNVRIAKTQAGAVWVHVRAAIDDQDACALPETRGPLIALEMISVTHSSR